MDQAEIGLYTQLLNNVGFPIVITIILLRSILNIISRKFDELNGNIKDLTKAILDQQRNSH